MLFVLSLSFVTQNFTNFYFMLHVTPAICAFVNFWNHFSKSASEYLSFNYLINKLLFITVIKNILFQMWLDNLKTLFTFIKIFAPLSFIHTQTITATTKTNKPGYRNEAKFVPCQVY